MSDLEPLLFLRLYQVPGKTKNEVAEEIVHMLSSSKFTNNKTVQEVLRSSDRYFVVWTPKYGIIGCGAISMRGEIKSIFIKPSFRKRGVATRLINFLEKYAVEELRVSSTYMNIKPDNEVMINLAKKLGYVPKYIRFVRR